MKKIKLVEAVVNAKSQTIEEIDQSLKPNFSIMDITVLSDESYKPTIQSILLDLEENDELHESVNVAKDIVVNILSETVNDKTGYSTTLFEFEHKDKGITLSLSLTESAKHNGVFNVTSYTTKGEKAFETNTRFPKKVIKEYMSALGTEYLIESGVK